MLLKKISSSNLTRNTILVFSIQIDSKTMINPKMWNHGDTFRNTNPSPLLLLSETSVMNLVVEGKASRKFVWES